MAGTRLRQAFREHLGSIVRELRVAMTPIPRPEKWVFVVGCYNSGTTLLAELLGRHSAISALETEGHFITDQFIKDYDIGLPRMWVKREDLFRLDENDVGPDVARIQKEWGMRLDLSKPILLEKSPPNAARTRWLQKCFPNAHFIGIVRNGYAVAEGIARKGNPRHLKDGWPIEEAAHQWARSNEILSADAEHLKHFMWVKYEDLTENTLSTLNEITRFLGVTDFSVHELDDKWQIHERHETVSNLNSQSINRLTESQTALVTQVAETMLRKFEYEVIRPVEQGTEVENAL